MYERLRDLREEQELTQKCLASYLNVSQATYSRYENGAANVPTETLIQLAEFYHTSMDYLLGRTNCK